MTTSDHNVSPAPPPTTSVAWVQDLADVIQIPPAAVTSAYLSKCVRVATFLKNPLTLQGALTSLQTVPLYTNVIKFPWLNVIDPRVAIQDTSLRVNAFQARSNVLAVIDQVLDFANKARTAGFDPPDNPFAEIARLNSERRQNLFTPLQVTIEEAENLIFNVKVYINLLDALRAGAIDLNRGVIDMAQLAHVSLSYQGLGGTGNTATDLLKFLPTMDDVRRARAEQAIAALDFTKRVPQVLFTLDYSPEGNKGPRGTIIGWRRIPDASGYVIKRRTIFSEDSSEIRLNNDQIAKSTEPYIQYVKAYALTFFENIDEKSICLYMDENPPTNEYFIYRIQAYQLRSESRGAIFSVPSGPAFISTATWASIQTQLKELDPTYVPTTGRGSISPWPVFAQQLLGDPALDWILAAVNVRASILRKDPQHQTRLYSYLNADPNFLLGQSSAGKLVKPTDVGAVSKNISDAIQKFGVTQVIKELLSETGITYYFEGWDPLVDNHFDRAGTLETDQSDVFTAIASAIDGDTATMDLKKLATNLATLLNGGVIPAGSTLEPGTTGPSEVAVPDPEMTPEQADGPLQYINQLGDLRDSVVDLTTFDGISKLLRVIRILSDFGPDRTLPGPPVPPPINTIPEVPSTPEEPDIDEKPFEWKLERRNGAGVKEIY